MFVKNKKEKKVNKRTMQKEECSEESVHYLRSWIRKIEQTTSSVSARVSAVEKRLSGGTYGKEGDVPIGMEGPIETLFLHAKKKNAGDFVRVLDGELRFLHSEVATQQNDTSELKGKLQALEKTNETLGAELKVTQTQLSEMKLTWERQKNESEQQTPLVMHVGSFAVPIELTGIIGGSLAFVIAFLVSIEQKEMLLSPVFLISVGVLLLGCAVVKMVRSRSRPLVSPSTDLSLEATSSHITPTLCKRKEG
jgi:hypothetical protein